MGSAISSIKVVYDEVSTICPILVWGTQGTARWSDLSEISQQRRDRTLSHLLHFKMSYKWHMAMYSSLISLILHLWSWSSWELLNRQGTETPFAMLTIHRSTFRHTLYVLICFGNLTWISAGSLWLLIKLFWSMGFSCQDYFRLLSIHFSPKEFLSNKKICKHS